MGRKKEYTKDELTIVWEADKCIHSGICVKGLPSVFRPKEIPWVNMDVAGTSALVDQVKQCPSGALSYILKAKENNVVDDGVETQVEVLENGPLLVHGSLNIKDSSGNEVTKNKTTAFCRCGASSDKPFCDGAHNKIKFKG